MSSFVALQEWGAVRAKEMATRHGDIVDLETLDAPYYIMVSLPNGKTFANIYRKSIKTIERVRQKIRIVSFVDNPTVREFSDEIRDRIHYSNAIICILSGNNHNVLYEVGLAIGFGKPILPIVDSVNDIPAMLKHRTAVTYRKGRVDPARLHNQILERLDLLIEGEPHMVVDDRHVTHIKQLIDKQPRSRAKRNRSANKLSDAEDLMLQGLACYRDRNFIEAIKLLAAAVKRHALRSPEVYFSLADSCFMHAESLAIVNKPARQYYAQMLKFARDGAKAYPKHQALEKSVGLACLNLRQLDEAEAIFKHMLEKDPHYPNAIYNLACISGVRGDLFVALRYLDKLFTLKPEWRIIARTDNLFDNLWKYELFQRILYPAGSHW